MNTSQALVPGSLSAIAQREGISIAESFMSADVITIVDVSGSMSTCDSRGGRKRYDVACQELQNLQASLPGKIAVVAFSDHTEFCPHGTPVYQGGGTDLVDALQFVKAADGVVKFIVISDGYPDEPQAALRIARQFKSQISCIYVGPEIEREGAKFLEELARVSGGRFVIAEKAQELANQVQRLMLAGG